MANPIEGDSQNPKTAGVTGANTASGGIGVTGIGGPGGFGVFGSCDTGNGVHGKSVGSKGIVGESQQFHGVFGTSVNNAGVAAESQNAEAVNALSHAAQHPAIQAVNDGGGEGVHARSDKNVGVVGESNTGRGVAGFSNTNFGVSGASQSLPGVGGTSNKGRGVEGLSTFAEGVAGISKQLTGVFGASEGNGAGVLGSSQAGIGVHGKGGRLAGYFEGDVEVTGDIRLVHADCAEDFDISGAVPADPGTVMVLSNGGALIESSQAYDKRVAGVISGAGGYQPGVILDRRQSSSPRQSVALMGKVYCKVDAQFGDIQTGDLLTTSPTPGHAMKAIDHSKAFGAVIGKALAPLSHGRDLLPILVSLQ